MYMPQGYDPQHIAYLLTIPNLAIGLGTSPNTDSMRFILTDKRELHYPARVPGIRPQAGVPGIDDHPLCSNNWCRGAE